MIVVCISDVPASLRGDLSKWLVEINVGVYVGRVSARVREALWKRIVSCIKAGRATMVYSAQCEQGMKFRVHNSEWLPIDFDGLTLMMQPRKSESTAQTVLKLGFSNAAIALKRRNKHFYETKKNQSNLPDSYIILDIETTGLNEIEDEILEVGALRVEHGEITSQFVHLARLDGDLPDKITKLTGITSEDIAENGIDLEDILIQLKSFIQDLPIVAHNAPFDMAFLRENYLAYDIAPPTNRVIDTLALARRLLPGMSHKLEDLMRHFQLPYDGVHRCLYDCTSLFHLYCKLIEISSGA